MTLGSAVTVRRRPRKTAIFTLDFISAVLTLASIIGIIFVAVRLTNTEHQEIGAGAMNPMPVTNKNVARRTISVLYETVCPEAQEQNQMVETGVEEDYNVVMDFVKEKLNISRDVYGAIIKITNEISKAVRLNDKKLESIANKVSTKTYPVTLTNLSDYIVLKVMIGEDTYVLKRMSMMPSINANDSLATKFSSPYIIEILMSFKNDAEEWIVTEYVGPAIPLYDANFTEEEIRLLVHDCLMGLDAVHKGGYYHKDLFSRNIVYAKDDNGETTGFKIIDFGASKVKDNSLMTPSELYDEIRGVLGIVRNYLDNRVKMRPKDVGYMEILYAGSAINAEFGPVVFMEEDSILADFLMTAARRVSKPATSISDLMKHQYLAGASADPSIFGEKLWKVLRRLPNGLPDILIYDT